MTSKIDTKRTVYMFIIASIYSHVAYTMKELQPHQAVRCSWFELLVVSQPVQHIVLPQAGTTFCISATHQILTVLQFCEVLCVTAHHAKILHWGMTHTVKTLVYSLYYHWACVHSSNHSVFQVPRCGKVHTHWYVTLRTGFATYSMKFILQVTNAVEAWQQSYWDVCSVTWCSFLRCQASLVWLKSEVWVKWWCGLIW